MTEQVRETVGRWLDEAAMAMGGDRSNRRDALLELETTIYDRVEERTQSGQIPDEAVRDVLDALGDPAEVAGSYAPVRPLLPSHRTRPYLINLVALFSVHFLLVIGASVAGRSFLMPPFAIEPIADPKALWPLLLRAFHTLVFDAGLLLAAFAIVPRLGRVLRVKTVRPVGRRCVENAFFMVLVLVVVDFFRDNLLAMYVSTESGTAMMPLVGPGIVDNLLWLNLWLGLAIVRELAYARLGERSTTLALDVASNIAGLFCLLRIVASKRLVDLSAAHDVLGPTADILGGVLNMAFTLIALATAALLVARLVRRGFRLALLHG
ncbi:MAG: permease prefix domain 1-containing protein [Planctomycetota bacterium]|jgi:hypothetical protein